MAFQARFDLQGREDYSNQFWANILDLQASYFQENLILGKEIDSLLTFAINCLELPIGIFQWT